MQKFVKHFFGLIAETHAAKLCNAQAYIDDDWRSQFPDSKVIITGGVGEYLVKWVLQVGIIDKNLIFWGVWRCREFQSKSVPQ